jgi:hypothetical protein
LPQVLGGAENAPLAGTFSFGGTGAKMSLPSLLDGTADNAHSSVAFGWRSDSDMTLDGYKARFEGAHNAGLKAGSSTKSPA